MKVFLILAWCFFSMTLCAQEYKKVKFKAEDGVQVVGDLYMTHSDTATFIILFHQAGWSRGEYLEIAPILNHMGFNCLAVDLRSGNVVNEVRNETTINARSAMKDTNYINSLTDMYASIHYARAYGAKGKLIIWGSSYSSSLVLKIAGDDPTICDAVMAFSPGEYFKNAGKPADFIEQSARSIKVPAFITSAKNEKPVWTKIYEAIDTETKKFFIPETSGFHGSRALWPQNDIDHAYWNTVRDFLALQ